MSFSSGRIHPVVVIALVIFAAYLAVFLLAVFPEHDHDHGQPCHDHEQPCAVCGWFNNLSIILPAMLALQLCFLYFRQDFCSFRSLTSSLLLPRGRAPPVS
ncbi:MAG: hypothetical protein OXH06_08210 [Gemmatimonadetes bacterium]|nr:hypothetical protein [Gemmatimonadota bacterium]